MSLPSLRVCTGWGNEEVRLGLRWIFPYWSLTSCQKAAIMSCHEKKIPLFVNPNAVKYAKLGVHLALVFFAEWPERTVEPAALHHAERDRFLCHPEEKTGLSLASAVRLVWLHLCFCINHLLSCPLSALQCPLSHPTSSIVPPSFHSPFLMPKNDTSEFWRHPRCNIKLKT